MEYYASLNLNPELPSECHTRGNTMIVGVILHLIERRKITGRDRTLFFSVEELLDENLRVFCIICIKCNITFICNR